MRRESSTVVVLVGEVDEGLLAGLGRSGNVSLARAPAAAAGASAGGAYPGGAARMGGGRAGDAGGGPAASTYVIVTEDPLAEVAAGWQAMWDVAGGPGAAAFEERAAEALAAWRDKRFELPDYYLVMAGRAAGRHRPGPLPGPAARRAPAPGRRRRHRRPPRPGRRPAGHAQVPGARAVVAAAG